MSVFLGGANPMDQFKCDLCGEVFVKAVIHEHHLVKRASGGQDHTENIARLDAYCHTALHQVEAALKNPKRGVTASDLATALYPRSMAAQKKVLELAAIAAYGRDPSEPRSLGGQDYSAFDTDDIVHLPPVKTSPKIRQYAKIVAKELRNPTTGRSLGLSSYLESLLRADLRRRGYPVD